MTSAPTAAFESSPSPLPLVSIIVPVFNYEQFIGETLENVLRQSYQNWECIVVDDGSTDGTRELVKEYVEKDQRFRYLFQRNSGPALAKNMGLSRASGKFVQFWDSDDLLETRKIETQVKYLETNAGVDIVYGSARYFRSDNPDERRYSMLVEDKQWMPGISGAGKEILMSLIPMNIMVIEAPLIRRTVIDSVGDFDRHLKRVEDWDYLIRCAATGKRFQYLDEEGTLALVRWHPGSISHDKRQIDDAMFVLRKKINATIKDEEVLQLNRQLAKAYADMVTYEETQRAVARVKEGKWFRGACYFARRALTSRSPREFGKWSFCVVAAPLAPRATFESCVIDPAWRTIATILRRR